MGKVMDTFDPGFPGAISRSVDDIVVAYACAAPSGLAFGLPVVLNPLKTGVVPFASANTAEDFIGVAVRSASKTPDTYGSNLGQYNRADIAEILVRGSAVVNCAAGTPAAGGAVYIHKASGRFVADASTQGVENVLIPNARWRGAKDVYNRAELVILERNA